MGYTTKFTGTIELSKPMSLKTAKRWMEIASYGDHGEVPAACPDSYLQWVPTEDLRGIVWDNNEKFYEYASWMIWVIANFLIPEGIVANGTLLWSGEETADTGRLVVANNIVNPISDKSPNLVTRRALTMRKLTDLT